VRRSLGKGVEDTEKIENVLSIPEIFQYLFNFCLLCQGHGFQGLFDHNQNLKSNNGFVKLLLYLCVLCERHDFKVFGFWGAPFRYSHLHVFSIFLYSIHRPMRLGILPVSGEVGGYGCYSLINLENLRLEFHVNSIYSLSKHLLTLHDQIEFVLKILLEHTNVPLKLLSLLFEELFYPVEVLFVQSIPPLSRCPSGDVVGQKGTGLKRTFLKN